MRSTTSGRSWSTSARRASTSGAFTWTSVTAHPRCVGTVGEASACPLDQFSSVGRPRRVMRALAEMVEQPEPTPVSYSSNVKVYKRAGAHARYDRRDAKRTFMGAIESVGFHVARLLPGARATWKPTDSIAPMKVLF